MPVELHSSYLLLLGSLFTEDKGLKILLSLKEAKIVAVKNPTPGLWNITTSSSGSHTLRITGLSSMYMTTGFGLKPVNRQEDAQAQPHAGNVLEDVYCRINKILQVIELRHQVYPLGMFLRAFTHKFQHWKEYTFPVLNLAIQIDLFWEILKFNEGGKT